MDVDADDLKKLVIREFVQQFFALDQMLVADVAGTTLKFQVIDLSAVELSYFTQTGESKNGIHIFIRTSYGIYSYLFINCGCVSHRINWEKARAWNSAEEHRCLFR